MDTPVCESKVPFFEGFPKMARLSRDCVITEKIDGTNAQIYIDLLTNEFKVGSRTRWITPDNDNHGFARWAYEHKDELMSGLGEGRHFGEWWGSGIQRGYGLKEKRFSLFNTHRWSDDAVRPKCCHVVPVLYEGIFDSSMIEGVIYSLELFGSSASPKFMNPEGIVIFHTAGGYLFKKTIKDDEKPKSMIKE